MIRLKIEEDNPCPYISAMKADERGKVTIPPKSYTVAVGPLDVKNNLMKLSKVEKYSYKEIDGQVYRVQNGVLIGPPVSKDQFEEIKKLHKEYYNDQKEDNGMEH